MNLGELRQRVSFLVNFNEGQVDQDFTGPSTDTNRHLHFAINEAYREEVNLAKQNGSRDAFKQKFPFTWPVNARTQAIPISLRGADILAIQDVTDSTPGPIVTLYDELVDGSGLYIHDRLTWGLQPIPSSARSFQIIYLANPVEMRTSGDEPELLPPAYHDLLTWSAGILLKTTADEVAPQMWLARQQALRLQLWKKLAQGSPMLSPPKRIRHDNPDLLEQF